MNDQGGVVASGSWPSAAQPVQKLQYDGRIGALYWIFIKNLLLNIITLSIYRFWGKTNLRRYAWSHTSLQGQNFEYTGRGGELFVGFLIVVGFYVIAAVAFTVATLVLGPSLEVIGQLDFRGPHPLSDLRCAICRAELSPDPDLVERHPRRHDRLRLEIRRQGLPVHAPQPGDAEPGGAWTNLRLTEDRFNHSYFGNAKASLQASAKPLYLSFILGFIGMLVGIALWFGAIWLVVSSSGMLDQIVPILQEVHDAEVAGREPDLSEEQMGTYIGFFLSVGLAAYLGIAIVGILAFAPYMAAYFRAIANNLQLAELRFSSEVTAWSYISLWIGNLLWVLLTLGLGFPVAVHRSLKFFSDRIAIHGELDVGRLQQTTLDRPKFGEGLLEAFDPGFL